MNLKDLIVDPNDYVVEIDVIGKGNFGTVSLVYPKKNKKEKIALKKIVVDPDDHDAEKSFMREILIMGELNHPCLVKLIGFTPPSAKDQSFYIYSKFMPNRTLLEVLKEDEDMEESKKTLDPTRRSIMVYGIASAMSYLHKKNIIHRDLKPENVFLNENYHPALSDFGLSRICSDNMKMTCKLGTPFFMAPELFNDEEEKVTYKIDVYAFALTLLSFFTTNYKFKGTQPRSINQLIQRINDGHRYHIPANTPKFYIKLIDDCWKPDYKERPSFDDILNLLEESDDFIFKGADYDEVHDFIQKTKNYGKDEAKIESVDQKKSTLLSSNKSSSEYEETTEFNF